MRSPLKYRRSSKAEVPSEAPQDPRGPTQEPRQEDVSMTNEEAEEPKTTPRKSRSPFKNMSPFKRRSKKRTEATEAPPQMDEAVADTTEGETPPEPAPKKKPWWKFTGPLDKISKIATTGRDIMDAVIEFLSNASVLLWSGFLFLCVVIMIAIYFNFANNSVAALFAAQNKETVQVLIGAGLTRGVLLMFYLMVTASLNLIVKAVASSK